MEEAWGDQEDLAKLSINQMIGLWASDATQVYHVKTSKDPADGLGAWAKRYVEFAGGYTTDYIFASSLLTNTSMRHVHRAHEAGPTALLPESSQSSSKIFEVHQDRLRGLTGTNKKEEGGAGEPGRADLRGPAKAQGSSNIDLVSP